MLWCAVWVSEFGVSGCCGVRRGFRGGGWGDCCCAVRCVGSFGFWVLGFGFRDAAVRGVVQCKCRCVGDITLYNAMGGM